MANYVKFTQGTPEAYANLQVKDSDTLYFIITESDSEGQLYLGSKLISGSDGVGATKLSELKDVINAAGLEADSLLVYDSEKESWIGTSFEQLAFTGATKDSNGLAGLVPKPLSADKDKFLRGDGTWANLSTNIQAFEVEALDGESHIDSIINAIENKTIAKGDIAIVKEKIYEDIYERTGYIYDGENWIALSGNYSAENVYFKNDLIFTTSIGSIEVPSSGSIVVNTSGKNLEQVFSDIFSKELSPEVKQPSMELITPELHSYEVGTKVLPSYRIDFNPGEYSYGPSTNVVITNISVSATGVLNPITELEGTFDEITIADDTEYYITATIDYSEGEIPNTNLGNSSVENQILAGQLSTTSTALKGYRSFYYGIVNNDSEINSALIRSLTSGGEYNEPKVINIAVGEQTDAKKVIIAIPSNRERVGLVKANLVSSMNIDISSEYKLLTSKIGVKGVNDYSSAPYDVWVYEPARILPNEVHEIILD